MSILLIVKANSFVETKSAARRRKIPIHDLAKNGGNLNEFRARTEDTHALAVQKWFLEPDECLPNVGYPPGTLLFYRFTDTEPSPMPENDLCRVDVAGYSCYVKGENARDHLETISHKCAVMKMALYKIISYNKDIEAGKINYRPEDHIRVAEAALAREE